MSESVLVCGPNENNVVFPFFKNGKNLGYTSYNIYLKSYEMNWQYILRIKNVHSWMWSCMQWEFSTIIFTMRSASLLRMNVISTPNGKFLRICGKYVWLRPTKSLLPVNYCYSIKIWIVWQICIIPAKGVWKL